MQLRRKLPAGAFLGLDQAGEQLEHPGAGRLGAVPVAPGDVVGEPGTQLHGRHGFGQVRDLARHQRARQDGPAGPQRGLPAARIDKFAGDGDTHPAQRRGHPVGEGGRPEAGGHDDEDAQDADFDQLADAARPDRSNKATTRVSNTRRPPAATTATVQKRSPKRLRITAGFPSWSRPADPVRTRRRRDLPRPERRCAVSAEVRGPGTCSTGRPHRADGHLRQLGRRLRRVAGSPRAAPRPGSPRRTPPRDGSSLSAASATAPISEATARSTACTSSSSAGSASSGDMSCPVASASRPSRREASRRSASAGAVCGSGVHRSGPLCPPAPRPAPPAPTPATSGNASHGSTWRTSERASVASRRPKGAEPRGRRATSTARGCSPLPHEGGAERAALLFSGEHPAAAQQPHDPRLVEDVRADPTAVWGARLVARIAHRPVDAVDHQLDVRAAQHPGDSCHDDLRGDVHGTAAGLLLTADELGEHVRLRGLPGLQLEHRPQQEQGHYEPEQTQRRADGEPSGEHPRRRVASGVQQRNRGAAGEDLKDRTTRCEGHGGRHEHVPDEPRRGDPDDRRTQRARAPPVACVTRTPTEAVAVSSATANSARTRGNLRAVTAAPAPSKAPRATQAPGLSSNAIPSAPKVQENCHRPRPTGESHGCELAHGDAGGQEPERPSRRGPRTPPTRGRAW